MTTQQTTDLVEDIKDVVTQLQNQRTQFNEGFTKHLIENAPTLNDVIASLRHSYAGFGTRVAPKSNRRWTLSTSGYNWFTQTQELLQQAGYRITKQGRAWRVLPV